MGCKAYPVFFTIDRDTPLLFSFFQNSTIDLSVEKRILRTGADGYREDRLASF